MATTVTVVVQIPDGDSMSPRDVITLADALRRTAQEIAPRAATLTNVAAAPAAPTVVIDLRARQVLLDGADIDLSFTEFEVLAQLVARARSVVARSELLTIADAAESAQSAGRRIDVHVSRIRAKLGRYASTSPRSAVPGTDSTRTVGSAWWRRNYLKMRRRACRRERRSAAIPLPASPTGWSTRVTPATE